MSEDRIQLKIELPNDDPQKRLEATTDFKEAIQEEDLVETISSPKRPTPSNVKSSPEEIIIGVLIATILPKLFDSLLTFMLNYAERNKNQAVICEAEQNGLKLTLHFPAGISAAERRQRFEEFMESFHEFQKQHRNGRKNAK
jgi:hypothetical protein